MKIPKIHALLIPMKPCLEKVVGELFFTLDKIKYINYKFFTYCGRFCLIRSLKLLRMSSAAAATTTDSRLQKSQSLIRRA